MIGLSFFERPILDHDAKAHVTDFMRISCEIRQISCGFHADFMKSGAILCGFHVKSGRFHVKSTWKPYKSKISRKTLQLHGV